ncbi:hypothetical protein ACIB24_11295 [Spongisporangium articulatum]|uniref:Uncharacterized protein n=1 Tax=Spongisporangium articulatum TaxID=3362603 RepID=A0ABW8AMN8_9ACTN
MSVDLMSVDAVVFDVGGVRRTVPVAILSNSADGAREEEERRYGFSSADLGFAAVRFEETGQVTAELARLTGVA